MSLPPAEIKYQQQNINDNLQPQILVAGIISLTAAYIAVILRLLSRYIARNKLGADDYTIIIALFFTSTFVILIMVALHFGLGKHSILMTNGAAFGKTILALQVLYNPAIFTTKLSILFLYRRIFPVRWFGIVLWCVGIFVAAYSITAAVVNVLQCLPINADWNPRVKSRCVNLSLELIIVACINVITDFVILLLPVPLVWRLQISTSRKLQVCGLFALGGFVCAVSIVRATTLSRVSITDESWVDTQGCIWSVVETSIAVVSACLPTFRPLVSGAPARKRSRYNFKDAQHIEMAQKPRGARYKAHVTSKAWPGSRANDEEELVASANRSS